MKLQGEDFVATTAIALGIGQFIVEFVKIYMDGDVSSYSFPSLFIGITASLLWTSYQIKKGANYSAVYSSFGLVLQLYILQKLIASRRAKKHSTTKHDNK